MIQTLLFSILTLLFSNSPVPESADRWLVELKSADDGCLQEWWEIRDITSGSEFIKKLPIGNWWVVGIPKSRFATLENLPCVLQIREDQKIDWRDTQPNDPAYINQGDMNLIGMTKAWDITTGGVTAQGDTIVVAVMDDGFQTDHEDLAANIWTNKMEIPDDSQDNDDNGYVDDFMGLNISLGNDNHSVATHGTSVSGIIGARGNNDLGVTGVNWQVKIMLISGANFESQLIESYQYALDMRKKYRQTNAAEGAFVVATNLSGGIDFAFAVDHPMWCEMYDKLGEEGILSVCSAPNNGISVDVDGDMPTTCTSPYMIAVTNVDLTDVIMSNAGYGNISIDIGAPGEGTVTIASGNKYKEFPGTSAATPHVTGVIALMYSTPCSSFLNNLDSDPVGIATRIRDIIFSTAKLNNSLNEITVTGKRIQASEALKATVTECGESSTSGVQILSVRPNLVLYNSLIQVYFDIKGDTTTAYFDLYDALGAIAYHFPISQEEFAHGYITIDAGPLTAGVYLLTLRNQKEKDTKKIVVVN